MTNSWDFVLLQPGAGERSITDLTAATSRILTISLDDASSASFTMPGEHRETNEISELATDLLVGFNGTDLFRGRIGPSRDVIAESTHTVEFTAWDYREVLNHRILLSGDTVAFSAVDQSTVAWTLANASQSRTAGNLGLSSTGLSATGVTRTITYELGARCGEEIDNLAGLVDGFEWDISPDLEFLVYYPNRGEVGAYTLELGGSLLTATRNLAPENFINVIRLTGADGLAAVVSTSSDLEGAPEGRWEKQEGVSDLTPQAAVTARSLALLARHNVPPVSWSVSIDPNRWSGPSDLWVGDAPNLVVKSGRLDINTTALRVTEMSFSINEAGETITATLGLAPRNIFSKVDRVLGRLSRLEKR